MLTRDWEDVSTDSLVQAIDNSYSEDKELEFKRQQNPDNKGHRQTTVGEAVSFANANGGDLVIGMVDEEGVASGLWPVQYDNVDEVVLRWVDIIKRNTDPEIPQHLIDIKPLEVTDEYSEHVDDKCEHNTGKVLVIRVQRSWRSPHRETLKNQFYERSSGGKTELDTGAIRQAMVQGELLTQRAREFRDDRLASIRADDVAVRIKPNPKIALHVVPSNAFSTNRLIDPSSADSKRGAQNAPPLLWPREFHGRQRRYTADGFLTATRQREGSYAAYTLTFHSGIVEAVTANSYSEDDEGIHSAHVRNCLEQSIPHYKEFLTSQGGTYPIYCFLSVVGGKGIPVGTQRTFYKDHDELDVIDRDVARLPAVQIESPQTDTETVINELLDSLYNASGKAQEMRVND